MRILHISDTHGTLPPLLEDGVDVVVHSGDFLPNRTRGIRAVEEVFQPAWVHENAARLRGWMGDRRLLVCAGNHDFVDPAPLLREAGLNAVSITDRLHDEDSVGFYGFPWVPFFTGEWNYELGLVPLTNATIAVEEMLNQGAIDVLVSHGPLYGVRDRNADGENCGSLPMRYALQAARHAPRAFLCGHIHEARGRQTWSRGIHVSNAALTQNWIDLDIFPKREAVA
jgi:Icc-related predicted phosphoesterase